jgi:hypothetical protein
VRVVRTDSPIYHLRAVWYGPGGGFPPARFTAWAFGSVLTLVLLPGLFVVGLTNDPLINLLAAMVLAPVVALLVAKKVFGLVDEWRTLAAGRQIIRCELDADKMGRERVRTHTAHVQRIHRL